MILLKDTLMEYCHTLNKQTYIVALPKLLWAALTLWKLIKTVIRLAIKPIIDWTDIYNNFNWMQ